MGPDRFSLAEIHVYNSRFVNGFQIVYTIDGERKEQPPHFGKHDNPEIESLILQPGERILRVAGRHGDIMDHLKIKTSTRELSWGDSSGGEGFAIEVPKGHRFVCFYGG